MAAVRALDAGVPLAQLLRESEQMNKELTSKIYYYHYYYCYYYLISFFLDIKIQKDDEEKLQELFKQNENENVSRNWRNWRR